MPSTLPISAIKQQSARQKRLKRLESVLGKRGAEERVANSMLMEVASQRLTASGSTAICKKKTPAFSQRWRSAAE